MFIIAEIQCPDKKSIICNNILRSLPAWFGNEEAIIDYADKVREMPFLIACDNDKAIGFLAIKIHNEHAAEVCVMGVLKEYHRQGSGKQLIKTCENYCQKMFIEFLTVKTLDASAKYEPYDRTRKFYMKMGFKPLEVFPLHWDKNNPCLFLVKHLKV